MLLTKFEMIQPRRTDACVDIAANDDRVASEKWATPILPYVSP